MTHRITYFLLALSLVLIQSASGQSAQRGVSISSSLSNLKTWGDYHALIIGINDYKEWPRLQTAVKDATVIKDTLIARYGFNAKNVILRTDSAASRRQITRDLRYLAKSMRKNDNLLVYYAGHGQLDDFTGDGYWVPAEGALKDPDTWVSNALIKAVLSSEKLQAKNVVVIADSCYSGSMLRGGPSLMTLDDQRYREKLVEKASLRSRQVISSGGIEPVADGGSEGHSLFAFYLINALRKNDREVIDLENLFHTRVWKPVTEIGDQRPNVGRLKTPMDQDGQFVLYNAAWVKQQVEKRTAVEAKKQEQARELSVVASAELELQRQRFEMEKQKLAYEKEQLAQQKAIELERLKLERQKQEFEYAKLQAQLEKIKNKGETSRQPKPQALSKESPPEPSLEGVMDQGQSLTGHAPPTIATKYIPTPKLIKMGLYTKHPSGVIYDSQTGLEWYEGPEHSLSFEKANYWAKSLVVPGGDWRLPTRKEIRSLYKEGVGDFNRTPLIESTNWHFWSADKKIWSNTPYYFNFIYGVDVVTDDPRNSTYGAIAVRKRK